MGSRNSASDEDVLNALPSVVFRDPAPTVAAHPDDEHNIRKLAGIAFGELHKAEITRSVHAARGAIAALRLMTKSLGICSANDEPLSGRSRIPCRQKVFLGPTSAASGDGETT